MKVLFGKVWVAAGAAIALGAVLPAVSLAAPKGESAQHWTMTATRPVAAAGWTLATGDPCPSYSLSQPFLAWGDTNEYTLLPGESVNSMSGEDWQLSRGAQLVSSTVNGGSTGQVLDMPAGSVAVTPPMCVNASNYPEARAMISDVAGVQGIAVFVTYKGDGMWGWPLATGMIKSTAPGWSLSKPIMLHAGELTGMHMVRLTLVAYGGHYRLYNLYVDPRRAH